MVSMPWENRCNHIQVLEKSRQVKKFFVVLKFRLPCVVQIEVETPATISGPSHHVWYPSFNKFKPSIFRCWSPAVFLQTKHKHLCPVCFQLPFQELTKWPPKISLILLPLINEILQCVLFKTRWGVHRGKHPETSYCKLCQVITEMILKVKIHYEHSGLAVMFK